MSRSSLIVMAVLASPAFAQSGPAVHALGPVVATSTVTFSVVSQLVSLSDGRVLVSDLRKRLLTMLDPVLAHPSIVLDSTVGKENSYATGFAAPGPLDPSLVVARIAATNSFLIPFRADSSLWYNVAVGGFEVITPTGAVGRVMNRPPGRIGLAWAPLKGVAASPAGGLVYTASRGSPPGLGVQPRVGETIWSEDSLFVVRWHFDGAAVDTLGRITLGEASWVTARAVPGGTTPVGRGAVSQDVAVDHSAGAALFPFYDGVTATPDGTIAIFHAREYRIEWIAPDGTPLSGARLTYPWQRITDTDRSRIIDSVDADRLRVRDSVNAQWLADSVVTGAAPTIKRSYSENGMVMTELIPLPRRGMPRPVLGQEVPDYYPPTNRATVLADADNHVWIPVVPTKPDPGFSEWEVISRTDGVVDRVRIPDNRTIGGFGPGGIIYLVAYDASVLTLEKVRIR
jgi:hypothetical protein